jgi:hypothetical protein
MNNPKQHSSGSLSISRRAQFAKPSRCVTITTAEKKLTESEFTEHGLPELNTRADSNKAKIEALTAAAINIIAVLRRSGTNRHSVDAAIADLTAAIESTKEKV